MDLILSKLVDIEELKPNIERKIHGINNSHTLNIDTPSLWL